MNNNLHKHRHHYMQGMSRKNRIQRIKAKKMFEKINSVVNVVTKRIILSHPLVSHFYFCISISLNFLNDEIQHIIIFVSACLTMEC